MGKYLEDFQLNNEQLQEILDMIEKLPDIPSAYKHVVSGTVTGSESTSVSTVTHTIAVTGLSFKPRHVMLVSTAGSSTACVGIYDTLGIRGTITEILTRTLSDTGFTLTVETALSKVGGLNTTYRYIAWA